jgi:hypothetical protein
VRAAALAVAAVLAALVAGCGVGAGDSVGGVTIVVTRDFGNSNMPGSPAHLDAPGSETAMRALQRGFDVDTRYGGGFVQKIAGVAGGTKAGRPFDWFYYFNGIEAPNGAADTELHRGDVVWWDHHDWGAAQRIPAVVGAWPEPFQHGTDGERFPARIECGSDVQAACDVVAKRLGDLGVIAGQAALGTRGGEKLLRVVVGIWKEAKTDFTLRLIGDGPGASGVFARPADDGTAIDLLDARGKTTRTLRAGAGLVAATAVENEPPVWAITGTDPAGVMAAARALSEEALEAHFAVAVDHGTPVGLPDEGAP